MQIAYLHNNSQTPTSNHQLKPLILLYFKNFSTWHTLCSIGISETRARLRSRVIASPGAKTMNSYELFQSEAMCHQNALMSYALRLTHNEKDAEDLVQYTLIRACKNFDKYEPGTNCKAWLSRIMMNEFITQYRHTQRERAMVDRREALDENLPDTSDAYIPDENFEVMQNDFSDEVSYALDHVPDDFRAIVIMADLQDESYREISEKLSIPIGTVMSRLFRGRQILRQKLHDYAVSLGIVRA